MAPPAVLNFPSSLLARTLPDNYSDAFNSPDTFDGPSTSTHNTAAKSSVNLSSGASAAIAVVFVVFMLSLITTICVCVRRSRRRSGEAAESRVVETASTIGDAESTLSMEKGEVKKPSRAWVPWRR